ncbi:hypothetical protein GEMRC1_005477 [Eukaryota sp. GEM-RC1]
MQRDLGKYISPLKAANKVARTDDIDDEAETNVGDHTSDESQHGQEPPIVPTAADESPEVNIPPTQPPPPLNEAQPAPVPKKEKVWTGFTPHQKRNAWTCAQTDSRSVCFIEKGKDINGDVMYWVHHSNVFDFNEFFNTKWQVNAPNHNIKKFNFVPVE